jgi:hypothetical protein
VRYESSLRDTPERFRGKGKRNVVSESRSYITTRYDFIIVKPSLFLAFSLLSPSLPYPTLLSSLSTLLFSTLHLFHPTSAPLLYSFTYFYLFLHLLLVRQGRVIWSKTLSPSEYLDLNVWLHFHISPWHFVLFYFIFSIFSDFRPTLLRFFRYNHFTPFFLIIFSLIILASSTFYSGHWVSVCSSKNITAAWRLSMCK